MNDEQKVNRPRLLPGKSGWRMGDQRVEGFDDDPTLSHEDRVRIARWAINAGTASETQRLLVAEGATEAAGAQDAIWEERRELDQYGAELLLALLDEPKARLVRNPATHEGLEGATYPLSTGQLATLVGVTPRQVRHWSNAGLVPTDRRSQDRFFYATAAAVAMYLAGTEQYEKAAAFAVLDGRYRVLALLSVALRVRARQLGYSLVARWASEAARSLAVTVRAAEGVASEPATATAAPTIGEVIGAKVELNAHFQYLRDADSVERKTEAVRTRQQLFAYAA